MQLLQKFEFKEILDVNETEKIIYFLGRVKDAEGEAILIITPKLINPSKLDFQNVATSFINDIYMRFSADTLSEVDLQMIFPINEKHKSKYLRRKTIIHPESGEEYSAKANQVLQRELSHIQWVKNIIDGKTQVERVIFRNEDFIILPDFKFSDLKATQKLHLMALFCDPKLHSLRDIKGEHIELLKGVRDTIKEILSTKFGMDYSEVRVYFHYPPTFYRLHIHIMNLGLQSLTCRVERSHDLNLVIQNLAIKSDYYQTVTLNIFQEKKE